MLDELRKGGFVIYLRHASTELPAKGEKIENLAHCETQRNLSAKGRMEAVRIGKAIRDLGIPIGAVTTSPLCRAKDTAKLAFGEEYSVSPDLNFLISTNAKETQRLADALRRMLSTLPAPGKNNVLISHSANLMEAAGIFPKPEGVAIVFRPMADGRFDAVARILPENWKNTAGPDQP